MKLDIELGMAGRYKLEAFQMDANGNEFGRRVVADWFDNLITNAGLDLVGGAANPIAYCQVGTGNAAPAYTDSTLQSYLATHNTAGPGGVNGAIVAGPPRYGYKRNVYRFNPGTATGNLSEVGVSPTPTGAVFSRALILDGAGNPTTITILPIEYLDVVYEIRLYVPDVDVVSNVTISGVNYTVTRRAMDAASGSHWADFIPHARGGSNSNWWRATYNFTGLIPITSTISGAQVVMGTAAYIPATYYIERTANWSITEANGNIAAIGISAAMGAFQFGFSPPIPKDNTKTLSLTFRIHWARR